MPLLPDFKVSVQISENKLSKTILTLSMRDEDHDQDEGVSESEDKSEIEI